MQMFFDASLVYIAIGIIYYMFNLSNIIKWIEKNGNSLSTTVALLLLITSLGLVWPYYMYRRRYVYYDSTELAISYLIWSIYKWIVKS